MITDRDREIINFIDSIGFATIEQITGMFFTRTKTGYDIARRRLKTIKTHGYLKSIINNELKKIIYLPSHSPKKSIKLHELKILDYLVELHKLDCDLLEFELSPKFPNEESYVIPDLFVKFTFNGYIYYQIVEIQSRHDFVNIERFNNDKTLEYIVAKCDHTIPSIIIVQDTTHDYSRDNNTPFNAIKIKSDISDIAKVLC